MQKKNSKGKVVLINLAVLSGLIILLEVGLRLAGYQAGPASNYINIKKVDSLIVLNEFFTDSNGIYIANKDFDWEAGIQINSAGFRTRELTDTANSDHKKRILLLGDSFTWGIAADPISKCFADQLEENGFQVFNLGIPGTDPAQYAALAETFIPKLKPDIVLVSFYMGNDWMQFPRVLTPNENIYHVTNAGGILAHFDGKYIDDPHEAYELQIRKLFDREYMDPEMKRKSFFKWAIYKALYKTAIGTHLIVLKSQLSSKSPEHQKNSVWYSNEYLKQIDSICTSANCRFDLFVIPWQAEPVDASLFKPLTPYIIQTLTVDDYRSAPNDHFNNSGHKKYLEFILKVLKEGQ